MRIWESFKRKEFRRDFSQFQGKLEIDFRVDGKDKSLEKFGINLGKNLMRINLKEKFSLVKFIEK